MPKFNVYFQTTADTSFTVEAESADEAIERIFDDADFPYICAQCSVWGSDYELNIGDDWVPYVVWDESGKDVEFTKWSL